MEGIKVRRLATSSPRSRTARPEVAAVGGAVPQGVQALGFAILALQQFEARACAPSALSFGRAADGIHETCDFGVTIWTAAECH
jgi:hypothetical protein